MKAVACAVLFVSSAWAICPNDCSGHGDCDHSSHCKCFHNWVGADCAQRTCTFGRAFVDSPWGDLDGDGALSPNRGFSPSTNFVVQGINYVTSNVGELGFTEYGYARKTRTEHWDEAHFYRECSNKGLCDRETGVCECFPGYEGSGCRRTACPQNCNGNGICRTILESGRTDAKDYSAWDGEKTQLCVCDPGWSGPACSMRSCPKGADPVVYNYKITDSIQGIYFRTFAPDKLHVDTEAQQHQFLKDKPSIVYFTLTYTDEYNDEWTTAVTTIEYTSFCKQITKSGAKGAYCLSTPTTPFKSSGSTNSEQHAKTRETLQRLSEHVNNTLLALPTRAIPTSYVWSGANSFDVVCTGQAKSTKDNDLVGDVTACLGQTDMVLKPRAFEKYPYPISSEAGFTAPTSDYVDSLDFRLDMTITKKVDQITEDTQEARTIDFDGTDNEAFGLGLFVKLPGPGVNEPLQVRYWYTPESTLGAKKVTYAHLEGTSKVGSFTEDNALFLKQDLVVVQDLVPKRTWNANDGDSAKEFSRVKVADLPYCSNRGICDFESGICNCFSGYTGLRCDTQNAVTYSY